MCGVKRTSDVRDHNLRYWLKTQGESFFLWLSWSLNLLGSPGFPGSLGYLGLWVFWGLWGLGVFGSFGVSGVSRPLGLWISGSLGLWGLWVVRSLSQKNQESWSLTIATVYFGFSGTYSMKVCLVTPIFQYYLHLQRKLCEIKKKHLGADFQ